MKDLEFELTPPTMLDEEFFWTTNYKTLRMMLNLFIFLYLTPELRFVLECKVLKYFSGFTKIFTFIFV